MSRNRAFTLVEVMVVVVIVGLLTAVAFPVFAKARGAAERASCVSNLKELALATSIYEQDSDGLLYPFGYYEGPKFLTWWGDLLTGEAADGLLYPYTKSGQIRGCPSALNLPTGSPHTYTMGYGVNFRLFYRYPPDYAPYGFRSVNLSQVLEPAETLLMADAAQWDQWRKGAVGTAWLYGDGWSNHLHARHTGDIANVAWLDGHVTGVHLYYHVAKLGVSPFIVDPKDLKACALGDVFKYPREDPNAPENSIRDQFYFLLEKPN
jgi:prepilin-type N-terminal cleavage/methylation domain-containing protein/prepilin-type processing-associated H-X9-DG protein